LRDEAEYKGDSGAVGLGTRRRRAAVGGNATPFVVARDLLGRVLPGEAATIRAAQEAIDGHRRGLRALWPFLGPAFIASVAYVDPGNFATDVAGGAKYGYLLLWAVLAANLMAMLVQTLSAKLGIATGRNLAEVCRDNLPRRVSFGLWLQAEVIAMATDLAEVLGAALGLSLLFGIPLGWGAVIAVAAAFMILALQASGFRQLEAVIAVFVGVIVIAFAFELLSVTPDAGNMADDLFSPTFHGEALLLAVGIVGATVMPHVIYLHSALTQSRVRGRTEQELKRIQRFERIDVLLAMSIAGLVNLSMLSIFAARFFGTDADSIEDAFHGLHADPGRWAAVLLGVALLASGLSSSSVGTLAGQIVMQGFIRRQIPLFARRAVTAAPALVVALVGVDPTRALVLSQVVLSFGIPFALVPLVLFTSNRRVMGGLVNSRLTSVAAWAIAGLISGLNVFLLVETFR
jgi:manganese transport protein